MPAGDIYELKVVCVEGVQASFNILHFIVTGEVGTGATTVLIAGAYNVKIAAPMKAMLNNNATYRGVIARRISPQLSIPESDASLPGVGTAGAVGLPKQTCGFIKLTTHTPGRMGRGRIYVPFPSQTDNELTGNPSAGYNARIATLATAMTGSFLAGAGGDTSTLECVIWHRGLRTSTFVTGLVPKDAWATQRRRGDFGRQNVPPI